MTRLVSLLALSLLLAPLSAQAEEPAEEDSGEESEEEGSEEDSQDEETAPATEDAPAAAEESVDDGEDGEDDEDDEDGEDDEDDEDAAEVPAPATQEAATDGPTTCKSGCTKACCSKSDSTGNDGKQDKGAQSYCPKAKAKAKAGCSKSGCKKSGCKKSGCKKSGCKKSGCKKGWSKGGHGHRHKLRLPAGISLTPVARVQVRATLFDQDDLEANDPVVYGDPGLREGISLRRVRIGLEASWKNIIDFRVVGGWDNRYDALHSAPSHPVLEEALFRVRHGLPMELEAGLGRVPFGRQATASSAHLALWERALASELMTPSREPLVTLRGKMGPKDNKVLPDGALNWAVSVSNGESPWTGDPDPSPRLTGRIRLDLLKNWQDHETGRDATGFGISVGGSINHNWGLEADTLTGGADLGIQLGRFNLQGEMLIARATPTFDTEGLPSLLSERNSLGWYAQLAVVIVPGWLEVAARVGSYDDNRAISDAGDRLDAGGGINFFLFDGHFKAQLHYVHREELSEGYSTPNDSLILQVQALL